MKWHININMLFEFSAHDRMKSLSNNNGRHV